MKQKKVENPYIPATSLGDNSGSIKQSHEVCVYHGVFGCGKCTLVLFTYRKSLMGFRLVPITEIGDLE